MYLLCRDPAEAPDHRTAIDRCHIAGKSSLETALHRLFGSVGMSQDSKMLA